MAREFAFYLKYINYLNFPVGSVSRLPIIVNAKSPERLVIIPAVTLQCDTKRGVAL